MDDLEFVVLQRVAPRRAVGADDGARVVAALRAAGFSCEASAGGTETLSFDAQGEYQPSTVTIGADGLTTLRTSSWELERNAPQHDVRSAIVEWARLAGALLTAVDGYVGFVSREEDDDLGFVVEEPPYRLSQPLALVALGEAYLTRWGPPEFAAGAELDLEVPGARVIVPSLKALL